MATQALSVYRPRPRLSKVQMSHPISRAISRNSSCRRPIIIFSRPKTFRSLLCESYANSQKTAFPRGTRNASYGRKTVSTTFGVVRGETVSPEADDLPPVTQFLGIPYGVAPSGQYRFKMAISAAKWTHLPKDTTRLSAVCYQTGIPELSEMRAFKVMSAQRYDHLHRLLPFLKPQSEDCLYMNIFVPERLEKVGESRLPVLLLVHGDEYGWNAGNPYNGSILASHAHIIVVTLNYRLGVFGFTGRCESNSCSGNSGLSDLVAALKMLSNVLPSFAGDPSTLTLMGWGSGASLVSLLMASPITQPNHRLFRRAILLDGTALSPWALTQNPQPYFFQLAEELRCAEKPAQGARAVRDQRSIDSVVRCMQDHSAENVTKAAQRISVPTFLSAFAPIVDGQMVPNHPKISFGAQFGALFRDIDLLVGMVSNPAHHLMPNDDLLHGIDKPRRDTIFRTLVRNLFDFHRKEILAATINEYTDWDNPKLSSLLTGFNLQDHPKTIRNGVLAALGDALYTAPLIETARLHSLEDVPKASNTFLFVFAHETRAWLKEQPNSGLRGSLSGDHVPYILGYPLSNKNREEMVYNGFSADDKGLSRVMMHYISNFVKSGADDKGLSRVMMHYISNFVKSGDPSKPMPMSTATTMEDRFHSTAWPAYSPATREAYLEITDRPRVKNYYRNAQVGFWNGFIPQLHRSGDDASVPEEHNLLANHFKRDSFFGTVRPYVSFHNDPFPPPPMPPTPVPKELKKVVATKPPAPETPAPTAAAPVASSGNYNTMLALTIAIGCGLLLLNICISLGIYRNRRDKDRKANGGNAMAQKIPAQYQSHAPSSDLHFSLNSPMGAQEPLLAASSKASTPGLMRPGISPTCPRHGRAAMAMAAARNNSIISQPNMSAIPTLEEIQV
uniref:COesterase domain-containing protein n=1 Tax=Steinernema glaseri TaxID=37863 RepID=A0A1I7XXL4_9BILA